MGAASDRELWGGVGNTPTDKTVSTEDLEMLFSMCVGIFSRLRLANALSSPERSHRLSGTKAEPHDVESESLSALSARGLLALCHDLQT